MTEQPPIQPTPVGALRFNTVTAQLEYFDGNVYVNIITDSPEQNTGGARAVTNGINENPQWQEHMDFFNIATTGNGQDFGERIDTKSHGTTASNSVRIVYFHGQSGLNSIEFVTTATLGNALDFGDMILTDHYGATSNSSATRGCLGGGWNPSGPNAGVVHATIEYIEIMSQGDAVDFGDLTESRYLLNKGCISTGHGGLG